MSSYHDEVLGQSLIEMAPLWFFFDLMNATNLLQGSST